MTDEHIIKPVILLDCTVSDRYFLESNAYAECAYELLQAMDKKRLATNFYNFDVIAFNCAHSIELFFKGAILKATGKNTNKHSLHDLYGEYKKHFLDPCFEFKSKLIEYTDPQRNKDWYQVHKYPTDLSGKQWPDNRHFLLDDWHEQAKLLLEDFKKLKPEIQLKYPSVI